MVTAHRVAVTFTGGRYPHRPTCSCGWATTWGYLTEFAAVIVADDHKEFHMPFQGLHACVGCGVELDADDPNDHCEDCASMSESEGWASYAAEQERHAETKALLAEMTREARLSRQATEKAVATRFARHEIERALRAVDVYDSVASDEDTIFHAGAAHAVRIIRDMLELDR